jgi:hypothetical protein
MDLADAGSTQQFADRIDDRDSGADSRRTLDYYIKGQKRPRAVTADNSLVGRVEAQYPGTRRYLTTAMWSLLEGIKIAPEALTAELLSCPTLQGGMALVKGDSDVCDLADFDGSIRPLLDQDRSFWLLEALILLQAWALDCEDREIASKISTYFHAVMDQFALPSGAEGLRRDLTSICFRYMFEPLAGPRGLAPYTTHDVAPVPQPYAASVGDIGAPASMSPEITPEFITGDAANRLFLDGRYPRLFLGLISTVLLVVLVFGTSRATNAQVFLLGATWLATAVATISPKAGLWTVGREPAIA